MQSYESITFEVEKDLTKSHYPIETKDIKSILNDIFKKRMSIIDYKTGKEVFLNANKCFQILHSTFDTKEEKIFNKGKVSLIQGLMEDYQCHYPITVTPDIIWLLILQ